MSIDHPQPESLSFASFWFLKPSHRTRPEQTVGFFIFLLISAGFELLNQWIALSTLNSDWFHLLKQAPWSLKNWPETPFWAVYHFLLAFSMWTFWRRNFLRYLKLELSMFFFSFSLQLAWCLSFFVLHETLLALIGLILLLCSLILSSLLFWKKERISGQLLIPPLIWVFYVMGINMVICIANP